MRNRLPLALCLMALAACGGPKQPLPDLVSDRPDATESAVSIPAGRVQVEAGYTYTRTDDVRDHTIGEVLARIGVGGGVELRLAPSSLAVQSPPDGSSESGFEDAAVGGKVELPATRLFPEAAVLVMLDVPVGSTGFGTREWRPSVVLASAWPLAPGVDAGVNAGWSSNGDGGELLGSAALGVELAPRLGLFVEGYGSTERGGDRRGFLNGGLTYAVTPDLQLDGRVGTELSGAGERFVGVGLVTRW